ncbi:DEAD/DEAH box helicase [bacterium]|nr:MAG: DEAD/DEAH box helicase [bacterium]
MANRLFRPDEVVPVGPAITLRDYQRQALQSVLAARDRGLHRVMVVIPTGGGKTTLFTALAGEFYRQYNEKTLIVAHRQELLDQAANRVRLMCPHLEVGVEGGDRHADPDCDVVVAGVQSIGRPESNRLKGFHPGLLIMDEGHHAPADTWQNVMRRFGSYEGTCFTLAVTATDHRMDNRPLHGEADAIFEDVVFRYPLRQAVADGWLVDLRGFRVATGVDISGVRSTLGDYNQAQLARAVNTEERNTTAYLHWSDVAKERRTIVFCVDVQHAQDVAELFRDRGVSSEHIDGTMKPDVRQGILDRFQSGETQVLVNVEIATEGFDAPECGCVLMLRPTQSWALYAQMAGRGVRTLPKVVDGLDTPQERRDAVRNSAKPDCLVIDVVDVSQKFTLQAPPEEGAEPPKKEKTPIASAAGLVGLPPEFDLQGRSVFDAIDFVEELPPRKRAELFKRPIAFDELSTVLSEVDLLKELSMPEEIVGASRLAWLKIGDGEYHLPCGRSSSETNRYARIREDELGRWTLYLKSDLMDYGAIQLGDDLAKAFDNADRMVHMTWPDCGAIVRADAGWREAPPTDRQRATLTALGVDDATMALVATRGQARALIEQRKLGNGRRKRR